MMTMMTIMENDDDNDNDDNSGGWNGVWHDQPWVRQGGAEEGKTKEQSKYHDDDDDDDDNDDDDDYDYDYDYDDENDHHCPFQAKFGNDEKESDVILHGYIKKLVSIQDSELLSSSFLEFPIISTNSY